MFYLIFICLLLCIISAMCVLWTFFYIFISIFFPASLSIKVKYIFVRPTKKKCLSAWIWWISHSQHLQTHPCTAGTTNLTLKALNKNCSRRHFHFLLFSFEENKAWCFKWILCLAEDSHETSSLIFSEKQWKNIYECRLLQSWLAL